MPDMSETLLTLAIIVVTQAINDSNGGITATVAGVGVRCVPCPFSCGISLGKHSSQSMSVLP